MAVREIKTTTAEVVDADTVRIGGDEFKRVRTCCSVPNFPSSIDSCSLCHADLRFGTFNYCQNCGAKVVKE